MQLIETGGLALQRMFAGLIEQTFQAELGIADPGLTDYLAELLCRFVRYETLFKVRDTTGRRLGDVAGMLAEAEARLGTPRWEVYRHIGDFTLFWSGVYPEALARLRAPSRADYLLDYREQGKRSYHKASTCAEGELSQHAPVLRRLSDQFDLCGYGLNRVRHEWEAFARASGSPGRN